MENKLTPSRKIEKHDAKRYISPTVKICFIKENLGPTKENAVQQKTTLQHLLVKMGSEK